MVQALASAGTSLVHISEVLTGSKVMHVAGTLEGDDLYEALVTNYPSLPQNKLRWFLEAPLHDGQTTWVLSKMWGTQTEQTLKSLVALALTNGFDFAPASASGNGAI
jgi:hypothetical protein